MLSVTASGFKTKLRIATAISASLLFGFFWLPIYGLSSEPAVGSSILSAPIYGHEYEANLRGDLEAAQDDLDGLLAAL